MVFVCLIDEGGEGEAEGDPDGGPGEGFLVADDVCFFVEDAEVEREHEEDEGDEDDPRGEHGGEGGRGCVVERVEKGGGIPLGVGCVLAMAGADG